MQATHCWQVDGAWRVGFRAPVSSDSKHAGGIVRDAARVLFSADVRLMQHYHTGQIEAVPVAWLKAYPQENIQNP
jgi:hypothetical protein